MMMLLPFPAFTSKMSNLLEAKYGYADIGSTVYYVEFRVYGTAILVFFEIGLFDAYPKRAGCVISVLTNAKAKYLHSVRLDDERLITSEITRNTAAEMVIEGEVWRNGDRPAWIEIRFIIRDNQTVLSHRKRSFQLQSCQQWNAWSWTINLKYLPKMKPDGYEKFYNTNLLPMIKL